MIDAGVEHREDNLKRRGNGLPGASLDIALTPEHKELCRKTYLKMITYSMVEWGKPDINLGAVEEIIGMLETSYENLKSYANLPEFEKDFADTQDFINKAKSFLVEEKTTDATRLLMKADGHMEYIKMSYYIRENPEQEESLNRFLTTGQC